MRMPDDPTRLAVSAALLPPDSAVIAWQDLLAMVSWQDATESMQRCLPLIAVNLRCHARANPTRRRDIPHAQQLAGVYRATWTANIVRFRALQGLFDEFARRSVDFRLLKGMAVCVSSDLWGSRRMGDVDLVVRDMHAAEAVAALRDGGFSPRFFRPIDDQDVPDASCWEGSYGQLVDLHVGRPGRRSPRILDLIVSAPPAIVSSQGRHWPVPTPAAMAVHAASHAQVGASASDVTQALLDLARLLPLADTADLGRWARAAGATGPLSALSQELRELGMRGCETPVAVRTEPLTRVAWRITSDVGRIPRVLRERSAQAPDVTYPHLRNWLYRPWFTAGQLRPLERLVSQTVGGFLREGALDLPRDRRRRVVIPHHLRGHAVRLTVTCADPYARLLFVDGVSHGVIQGVAHVSLDQVRGSIELSLRLLGDPGSVDMRAIGISVEGLSTTRTCNPGRPHA